MTDLAEKNLTRAIVPFTYTSRRIESAAQTILEPSRLSLMAFDAATFVAEQTGVKKIVIAGEQSYSHDKRTTGDLLQQHTQEHHDFDITVLRNDSNRLLNTPHQVDALSEEFSPTDVVTVVCWGFHEQRIRHGFEAQKQSPIVEFVHVEDVISRLWDTAALWEGDARAMLQAFKERYNMQAGWEAVMSRGLPPFERREKITRLAMKFGKNGWLIKLLTELRGKGRYDDIDEFAMPKQGTTR